MNRLYVRKWREYEYNTVYQVSLGRRLIGAIIYFPRTGLWDAHWDESHILEDVTKEEAISKLINWANDVKEE
jgi:hypothetical protein